MIGIRNNGSDVTRKYELRPLHWSAVWHLEIQPDKN